MALRVPGESLGYTRTVIKTVALDMGNVIVPFDVQRVYRSLAQVSAVPADQIPKLIAATDLVTRFESGEVAPEEFSRELCRRLELTVDYAGFCDLWSSMFLPETLIPENVVAGLRRRFRVMLLSNTNAIHFAMVRRTYPILRHFDEYILSHEVGAIKPAPKIFHEAIARAGCPPDQMFYTDDIPAYVEAARQHGIDAVQFQSFPQLEHELRARGIEWE